MVREPAVAGQFYPATQSSLKEKIEECFKHELGPGSIPSDEGNENELNGLVCPHAGYPYSGPVAAHSYNALVKDGIPETVILLGPSHRGLGAGIALAEEDFKTPLGTVEIDDEINDSLIDSLLVKDDTAHSTEHSIEVQLPFLQYFSDSFKIVAISFNKQDYKSAKKVGNKINDVLDELNKDATIIASTDFSHYVLKENAEKKDKKAIDCILKNEPEELYETIQEENISMCGYGPVMSMMFGSGGEKGELLKYATSGDVVPQKEVVGYGAIAFK